MSKEETNMKTYLLHPATFKLDGGAMFGIIPKPLWSKKIMPDEYNRILMALRVVFIETDNRKILIDTGIGDFHAEKFKDQFEIKSEANPLVQLLKNELSTSADEITDIILTHLHFDHVGGLVGSEKEIIFPNATIHLHKNHYEYSLKPTLRDSGSFHSHIFKPALDYYKDKNQIHFVTGEDGQLIKDKNLSVAFKTSFGHTPHMLHPVFDKFIYMADLVPMSHHVHLPWVMGYDISPGVTTEYKEKFYQEIIEKKLYMIFEHDIDTWGGQLKIDEKGKYNLIEALSADKLPTQLLEL